jgi:hypothetical protein
MKYIKTLMVLVLLIPQCTMPASPYRPYNNTQFQVGVRLNADDCPAVLVSFVGMLFFGGLSVLEYNQMITIIDAFKKGDHQILAMHKDMIDRIYARIKARLDRAQAFGYSVFLSPEDEHDMTWVYNEQKEMQAFYDNYNTDYLKQLKYNFKWKAAGHGTVATISGVFAAFFGYIFYQEMRK